MNIRLLKPTDYLQFYTLINQFRKTIFSESQFLEHLAKLEKKDCYIYVIEEMDSSNNLLVAAATLIVEDKFIYDLCKLAHIEDVIVDTNYRKHGYGKSIVNHLVNRAKNLGCYKITLDCADENVGFYSACQFEKRGNQMSMLL